MKKNTETTSASNRSESKSEETKKEDQTMNKNTETTTSTSNSSESKKAEETKMEDQTMNKNTETTTSASNSSESKKAEETKMEDQTMNKNTETTTSASNSSESKKAPESSPNVRFYKNEIPASPNEESIEDILKWYGDYAELEFNHSYIQWLFPNRETGMNSKAFVLTDEDVEIIHNSDDLRAKVKAAFEMMLDFYGMKLTSDNQFELAENSELRLLHLNRWANHNFLRITRILLALKELGHKELTLPWLKFFADLIYTENKLDQAQSSFEKYWIDTLDANDKLELIQYRNKLKRDSDARKPSKNIIRSPRIDNKEHSSTESVDISRKSNENDDTVTPGSASLNDNTENSTDNSSTDSNEMVPKSTLTIPKGGMPSSPVSEPSKPIDTKAMEDDGKESPVNTEPGHIVKHITNLKQSCDQFS